MIITNKCPNCGGILIFHPDKQCLFCAHCESEIGIENHNVILEKEENSQQGLDRRCASCGGDLEITDDITASLLCPYCESPNVLKERVDGEYKPDLVIPFLITKEKVKEILKERVKKNRFGPPNRILQTSLEQIRGVYIPYWLFDYDAKMEAQFECTKVLYSSDSEYNYTETQYYNVHRKIHANYEKIPADASKEMDDTISYALEPFKYENMKSYDVAYLMGFLTKKYDIKMDKAENEAQKKLQDFLKQELNQTIGYYDTTYCKSDYIEPNKIETNYAMFPIWITNMRYNGKNFSIFVNGQTGKVIGDFPIFYGKVGIVYIILVILFYFLLSLFV